jgi:uncharacterized membrane protein/predicted transcriptional regulator/uncharacterized protein YwbE
LMTTSVQYVSPDQTLDDAARVMVEHDIGAVPVMEDDRPVGIVTDRDIAIRAVAQNRDPSTTTIGEVMSGRAICCRENDSVQDAANIMERHQVRRLMVLDDAGYLCGIVSLGDLALRNRDEDLSQEVLEEVSRPGHVAGGARSRFATRRPLKSRAHLSSAVVTPALMIASALTVGAIAMYVLDPARGKRRRAVLRDKAVHLTKLAKDRLGKTARYTKAKTSGIFRQTQSMLHRDAKASDPQVRGRIRAALGRAVSHPHAITVDVDDGVVTLSGPILANEIKRLISAVLHVKGVQRVINRLEPHETRGRTPALQGGSRKRSRRVGVMKELWSPGTRVMGIVGGGALVVIALLRRDLPSVAGGTAGLALAARSLTNIPTRRLVGVGAGRRAVDVQKDININAPIDSVFKFFARYQNFPHFMSKVREVRDNRNGRSHWVVAGPAGIKAQWDAEITRFEPNKTIAWRSVPGSMVENAGIIRFEPNHNGGTRVNIKLSYNPPGGALGHVMAKAFGADAKSDLNADLMRVKTLIETGHPAHDAAQPAWS